MCGAPCTIEEQFTDCVPVNMRYDRQQFAFKYITYLFLALMISGKLQELMGYRTFFIWIIACCAVTCVVSALIKYEPDFGKKQ